MLFERGQVQAPVGDIHVGVTFQQQLADARVASRGGEVEARTAVVVDRIDGATAIEEQRHRLELSALGLVG